MSISLFPWQRDGIQQAVETLQQSGGYYLEWDPGMGKTLGALIITKLIGVERVVVICPKVGLGVWKNQIRRWWPQAGGAIINRQGTVESWRGTPFFLITNYDQIRQRRSGGKLNVDSGRALRRLLDQRPQLVILDEAHAVKSISSAQHKAARALCAVADYRLMLSGTPAHSPLDWHPQYNLLVPLDPYWGRSYTAYKQTVAIPHPRILGAINTRAGDNGFRPQAKWLAQERRVPYTHVARSDEMHVPEPIFTEVPVELTPHERQVYRQMDRNLFAETNDGETISAPIALTKFLRLHQITGGFVGTESGAVAEVGDSKLEACLALLDERSHQKVIVACRFRAEIEALSKRLGDRPFDVITGNTPGPQRSEIEQRFQTTDQPQVLLLQYRAGGVSLTLTAAKTMILFSFEPSVIAYRQMIGRGYRIGSETNLEVLPLLATDSIDERLYDGLRQGLDSVDLVRFLREQQQTVGV